jgi:hypothetical protein
MLVPMPVSQFEEFERIVLDQSNVFYLLSNKLNRNSALCHAIKELPLSSMPMRAVLPCVRSHWLIDAYCWYTRIGHESSISARQWSGAISGLALGLIELS